MGFFDLFMRRQLIIQESIGQYMDTWIECIRAFTDAWNIYFQEGLGEEFFYRVDATHKEESRADDLRRQIEHQLYSKALLPESRGDILGVLETVDSILTQAEWTLYELRLQEILLPEEIKANMAKVVDLTNSCCEVVNRAVRQLFVNQQDQSSSIETLVREIDNLESEIDHLERSMIRTIFKMDMSTGEKVMYKGLLRKLTKVSDEAEMVGDRLILVSVKRRV